MCILREEKDTSENEDIVPYVSTFNPNFEDMSEFVNATFKNIKTIPSLKNQFSNTSLIKSKRQPPNLKRMLTSARFNSNPQEYGVVKCGEARCKLCECIIEGKTYFFKRTGITFHIKAHMNCNTRNCVYVMECMGCNFIYVGETNNLRLRVNLHRDHIKHDKGYYVSHHIHSCGTHFKIMPFYKVSRDCELYRKTKEQLFIDKFKPELNRDL
jgi:hypothetical protein